MRGKMHEMARPVWHKPAELKESFRVTELKESGFWFKLFDIFDRYPCETQGFFSKFGLKFPEPISQLPDKAQGIFCIQNIHNGLNLN